MFFDDPMLGTITAPDLTRAVRTLSDAVDALYAFLTTELAGS